MKDAVDKKLRLHNNHLENMVMIGKKVYVHELKEAKMRGKFTSALCISSIITY